MEAREVAKLMLNSVNSTIGDVILGASTSALIASLAATIAPLLKPGDEVVVCEWSHEANIAPWLRCAAQTQSKVCWWTIDRASFDIPAAESISALVTPRTVLYLRCIFFLLFTR